jgi:hypothetical protein
VVLAGAAAFLLWKENNDWAFACGVLAVCSFFLSIRFQFKARIREREATQTVGSEGDANDP